MPISIFESVKASIQNKIPAKFKGIKFFTLSFLLVLVWASPALSFDFSNWDELVKKYVKATTIDGVNLNGVNYSDLKMDSDFKELIIKLERFSPSNLKTKEGKLVFWINVYNIMAVKMILDNYPLDSIKDAGSFLTSVWNKPVGVVGGKERTLNEIEHEILRKMGEPRIHVAIVCASVSCPDLRAEAYTKEKLNEQLDDQVRKFLANPTKGIRLDKSAQEVHISSIFDWFEEDFNSQGGVLKFIRRYAPEAVQKELSKKKYDIEHLDYNWDLNKI